MLRIHLKVKKNIVTIKEYEASYPFSIYAGNKPEKKIYWNLDTLEYSNMKSNNFRISYSKKIILINTSDGITYKRKDGTEVTPFNIAKNYPYFDAQQMLLFEKRHLFFLKSTNYSNTLRGEKQILSNILLKRNLTDARENIQFHLSYVDNTSDSKDILRGDEFIILNLNLFEEHELIK